MIKFLGGLSILSGLITTYKDSSDDKYEDKCFRSLAEQERIENEECNFIGLTKTLFRIK